jgi:hypothetical protein
MKTRHYSFQFNYHPSLATIPFADTPSSQCTGWRLENLIYFQGEEKTPPTAPQREYEEPNEPDMNPEKHFPDKEIDYPRQDEILDDEPLREIKEPSEKEFDDDQHLPNEEETFPGVFPKQSIH